MGDYQWHSQITQVGLLEVPGPGQRRSKIGPEFEIYGLYTILVVVLVHSRCNLTSKADSLLESWPKLEGAQRRTSSNPLA